MESADSKSGARFERVTIDGDAFVLKHVDRSYDWIARQSGDLACWPIVVWERGLVDLAPECIDHTIVGAARTTTGGALLMRDASAWLVPADDTPLCRSSNTCGSSTISPRSTSACWGWVDTDRLVADGQPLRPVRPGGARVRGCARSSRTGDAHRRGRLGAARARRAADGGRARTAPARAVASRGRARGHATHLSARRLEARQPRQPTGRPHRARRLVVAGLRTAGRRARALPRAECGAAAGGSHEGRRDRGIPRVARTPRRRHRAVVGPPARPLPARRHAATRVGEVVRRDRRRARRGGPRVSTPVCGSSGETVRHAGGLRRRVECMGGRACRAVPHDGAGVGRPLPGRARRHSGTRLRCRHRRDDSRARRRRRSCDRRRSHRRHAHAGSGGAPAVRERERAGASVRAARLRGRRGRVRDLAHRRAGGRAGRGRGVRRDVAAR